LLVPFFLFIWNDLIEQHLAAHGVTPDEAGQSRTSGRPVAFGGTSTGKYLACVYELLDETTVLPVTACEVED
jgi:hypothetical protein